MRKILVFTMLMFLSLPTFAQANDSEVEQLKNQIDVFEDVIESLESKIEELQKENEELKKLLDGEIIAHEGIKEVSDITEIQFNTELGNYQVDEMYLLPIGQKDSYFDGLPALLVLYEIEVKQEDYQSNNLFVFDIGVYQESDVSYSELYDDTIQFYLPEHEEYFQHFYEIIKKGATIKNATLFVLENTDDPVIFEKDDTGFIIDLDEIKIRERSN